MDPRNEGAPPLQRSRQKILPNARETVRRWRPHFFRAVGLGDPYIVMAQVYGDATLIHPAAYHSWLTAACENTFAVPDASERIVFIDAWNEWAEGAHSERIVTLVTLISWKPHG